MTDLNTAYVEPDLYAEKCLVGTLVIGPPSVRPDIFALIEPNMLWSPDHQIIAQAYLDLGDFPLDEVMLRKHLLEVGKWKEVRDAVVAAMATVPTWVNGPHYARIVRTDYLRRMVAHEFQEGARELFGLPGHAPDWSEVLQRRTAEITRYTHLLDEQPGEEKTIGDLLKADSNPVTSLLTGLRDVDECFGGLTYGELSIVAGRPSSGKTTLANTIVLTASELGVPVAYFSLEVGWREIALAMVSAMSNVYSKYVRDKFPNWDNTDVKFWWKELTDNRKIFYSEQREIGQIIARATGLIREQGVKLVVIDYLQLVGWRTKRDKTENERLTHISQRVQELAKTQDVVVLALSQLARTKEAGIRYRPRLNELRGSGSLEQDADNVWMLHCPWSECKTDHDREKWKGRARLECRKRKHGPVGAIWLRADFARCQFTDLDRALWPAASEDSAPMMKSEAQDAEQSTPGEEAPF